MTKKNDLERDWRFERRENMECIKNKAKELYEKGLREYKESKIDQKAKVPKWE